MHKSWSLNTRHYIAGLSKLNEHLAIFPVSYVMKKMVNVELNKIILCVIPRGWEKQAFLHVYIFKTVLLKKEINLFKRMGIAEQIMKV